jgi:two-component system, NarL family, response regulator DevR
MPSGDAATILVVDDHEVVRSGLVAEIDREEGFSVVGVAGNGADAFEWAVEHRPDLVLMDWRLPDKTGVDVCRELREAAPDVRVVILTTYISEETVRQALAAGARGYVTKSAGLDALFDAMRDALSETSELGTASQVVEHLHEKLDSRMEAVALTPQQQKVLDLAAQGLTNQQIADRLFVSESTVRFHLKALRGKLEASSKAGLISKAVRLGLLPPADEASTQKEG